MNRALCATYSCPPTSPPRPSAPDQKGQTVPLPLTGTPQGPRSGCVYMLCQTDCAKAHSAHATSPPHPHLTASGGASLVLTPDTPAPTQGIFMGCPPRLEHSPSPYPPAGLPGPLQVSGRQGSPGGVGRRMWTLRGEMRIPGVRDLPREMEEEWESWERNGDPLGGGQGSLGKDGENNGDPGRGMETPWGKRTGIPQDGDKNEAPGRGMGPPQEGRGAPGGRQAPAGRPAPHSPAALARRLAALAGRPRGREAAALGSGLGSGCGRGARAARPPPGHTLGLPPAPTHAHPAAHSSQRRPLAPAPALAGPRARARSPTPPGGRRRPSAPSRACVAA
ncbi:uncharacterized protein LOC114050364 [Vombatus ursinus]|uniref:uncharacterized protein LOC114050364 n=1 Tax=Vombatus ursinus TaxID=29139 RepID=UPI000FFD0035|nr:uncharacterized protein LOC114050364 [Vombatus ursinus]